MSASAACRRDESIVFPPSHCPSCDYKIPFYDNIPIISYIILRGKCRSCKGADIHSVPVGGACSMDF